MKKTITSILAFAFVVALYTAAYAQFPIKMFNELAGTFR